MIMINKIINYILDDMRDFNRFFLNCFMFYLGLNYVELIFVFVEWMSFGR